jgi:tRNA pseudouridine32 synthase/23S rRNA pseudouridine746 synthase
VGTPNAHTEIEWLETRGAHARYRLRPLTGKRHQLRVHMAALGLPILGDRIYPRLLPQGGDDPGNPLAAAGAEHCIL